MSILLKRPGRRFVLRGKVWGLKTSQAMAEFFFWELAFQVPPKIRAGNRCFNPRAMLVTEIGGARPPNEIVLD